jgi:hypothetical protein
MKRETWNKCDVCGKFIAMEDFSHGAVRKLVDPYYETWETLCRKHAPKPEAKMRFLERWG